LRGVLPSKDDKKILENVGNTILHVHILGGYIIYKYGFSKPILG